MKRHVASLLLAAVLLAGCGQSGGLSLGGSESGAVAGGLPALATKNTTRISAGDAPTWAAAVALAAFPGAGPGSRPRSVTLADDHDWRTALAAAALIGPPVRAPLLLTDGGDVPGVTDAALRRLQPAQVYSVGGAAGSGGRRGTRLTGPNAFAVAASVASQLAVARHGAPRQALVVSADAPRFAMAAAGLAAKTGTPILFVRRDAVPRETRDALARMQRPRIYVIGPGTAIARATAELLRTLGPVKRIAGHDPAATAVAVARFADRQFGWGAVNPGHGLVFANVADPLAAPAAAGLSASGTYGPLLLVDRSDSLPAPLANYLLAIQPGYVRDPAHGVYNHGWLIGDQHAISMGLQASIDGLLEIAPVSGSAP